MGYSRSSSPCPSSASLQRCLRRKAKGHEPQPLGRKTGIRTCHVRRASVHGAPRWVHIIVKAERSVCGLEQSGRQWGYHAADTLAENGFEKCGGPVWLPQGGRRSRGDEYRSLRGCQLGGWVWRESQGQLLASLIKKFPTRDACGLTGVPSRET